MEPNLGLWSERAAFTRIYNRWQRGGTLGVVLPRLQRGWNIFTEKIYSFV